MSGRTAIYDLAGKSLILMGLPISDNFVSLEIEPPERYVVVKSADGSMTRCATGDSEYKLKLTLVSSSKHTAELAALHAADAIATGGSGVAPFFYQDGTGSTKMAAAECWISKAPTRKISNVVAEETWEITAKSDPAKMLLGGNEI